MLARSVCLLESIVHSIVCEITVCKYRVTYFGKVIMGRCDVQNVLDNVLIRPYNEKRDEDSGRIWIKSGKSYFLE